VTLTTARVLGEFGAVVVVSGNITGKTQTMTLFISNSVENLNSTAAYAGAVLLALLALFVLAVMSAEKKERGPDGDRDQIGLKAIRSHTCFLTG